MSNTKHCGKCDKNLPISEFGKNKARYDGLQSHCKSCRRLINNEYYKNSEVRRETVKRNRNKFKLANDIYINNLKKEGCSYCEETEPCTLDFHHLYDKKFNISEKRDRLSTENLKKEIEKCILVCSNCHRKIHSGIIPNPTCSDC